MKATDKQLKTLKRLGVMHDENVTKVEAIELINEEIELREQLEDMEYNLFIDDDIPLFDRSFEREE